MTEENRYKVWWDEELQIVRGEIIGTLTMASAEGIQRDQDEIIEKYGEGRDWLIDLSRMKKAKSDARKKMVTLDSNPKVGRFAFYGAPLFVRTVVNFVMTAAGKNNVKHFSTEEDALQWLKANK